jgi:hypothetical protein
MQPVLLRLKLQQELKPQKPPLQLEPKLREWQRLPKL